MKKSNVNFVLTVSVFTLLLVVTFAAVQAAKGEAVYTAMELLHLNSNYCSSFHSLEMEYSDTVFQNGKELVSLPTARWILTPDKERLLTSLWYLEETESKSDNANSVVTGAVCKVEPLDFFRETGKRRYVVRGEIPSTDPVSVFDENVKKPTASCVMESSSEFDYDEPYFLHCPGDSWLHMRSRFLMRFSHILNPPDETLASFAAKHRVSQPMLSENSRKERIWTFKIFPKEHIENENDNTRYIEVSINESRSFLLEKLTYYCRQQRKGMSEPGLVVDSCYAVSDYILLNNGAFFPKEVLQFSYVVGEVPESGLCRKYSIKSIKVNSPVPESEFNFRIPPYTRVGLYPPVRKDDGSDFFRESIWGPDNKPLVTFESEEEFDAYMKAEWEKHNTFPLPSGGISLDRIIFAILGIVMILIGLILHYRSKSK
ncbi:hypothetical protein FACS1894170_07370 [Planctomycetales bacterium]|nr:hypothetical protein FACS1894170_07370 [Planctomycetales bacterium]